MSAGERTEKPTAKRQRDSRKEGRVPRTQELGGWASLLLVGLALPTLLSHELGALRELMITSLTIGDDATPGKALALLGRGGQHILVALVGLGCAVMLISVGAALAQGGFFVATKAVKPTFSKLNPIQGAKRIFGPQAFWEGGKMLIKSALVGLVAYAGVRSLMPMLGGLVPIPTVLDATADRSLGMIRNIGLLGLGMAAADYAIQRRRIGKQVRMTKDEVKQEHKQTEGDPLLKSAIRSRQLAAARNRMMADVATADVVLVNPTHVAVALAYDSERGAPRVVARGAGAIAAKIRELAGEERVPLVRDVPLARALYRSTKVGQEIPPELFAAVAQVLAFVISRKRRGVYGGEHRTPRRTDELPDVPKVRRPQRAAQRTAQQETLRSPS